MTIYLNGVIFTLDPAQLRVEAVACEYGRVVAVGRSYELQALARSPADIVDLQGRTAIPGLIDAHIHLLSLGLALGWVDLGSAGTLSECVQRVARRAREREPGCWILGRYGPKTTTPPARTAELARFRGWGRALLVRQLKVIARRSLPTLYRLYVRQTTREWATP